MFTDMRLVCQYLKLINLYIVGKVNKTNYDINYTYNFKNYTDYFV